MRSPGYKNYVDGVAPNSERTIMTSTANKTNTSTSRKTGTSFSVKDEGEKRFERRGSDMNNHHCYTDLMI